VSWADEISARNGELAALCAGSAEASAAAMLMTQMLHLAVHDATWARPESPQDVWLGLLEEVARDRVGT
jgi:hypothetical protein